MTEIAKSTRNYENEAVRTLLREVMDLEDPAGLPELQSRIRQHLEGTDRRRLRKGFSTPEAQAERERSVAERRAGFAPIMRKLHGEGLSFEAMARALNEKGVASPAGGPWSKGSVKYQFDRLPADQE